jgi:hypothetical protein
VSGASRSHRALSLDHVGFVGADLAPLVAAMRDLGFATTEPAMLMGADPATGAPVSLQQQSCHAVFATGYLELSAVLTADPAHHLAAYRARGAGLHIVALGSPDPDADWRRCTAAGLPCSAPVGASRRIEYGARRGEARFRWFMLHPAVSPEGLLCVVCNETPELVFQPEVTRHPNGAEALCEVIIQAGTPVATAARLSTTLGFDPRPIAGNAADGLRFVLDGGGAISLLSPRAMAERFGVDAIAGLPPDRFAALRFRVRDVPETGALLRGNAVPFEARGSALIVPASTACGAVIAFG